MVKVELEGALDRVRIISRRPVLPEDSVLSYLPDIERLRSEFSVFTQVVRFWMLTVQFTSSCVDVDGSERWWMKKEGREMEEVS